jgi:hypothetical protein
MRGAGSTGNRKDGRSEPPERAGRPKILCPYQASPEKTRNYAKLGIISPIRRRGHVGGTQASGPHGSKQCKRLTVDPTETPGIPSRRRV